MGSRVIDTGARAKIRRGVRLAKNAVAEQILSDSTQYIPKQEGTLRDSGRVEAQGEDVFVIWDTPYAAYQYYGCWPDGTHQVMNHSTAGTFTQWVDHAKRIHGETWERVAQNAIKAL